MNYLCIIFTTCHLILGASHPHPHPHYIPWTTPGDFRPQTPNLLTPEKILPVFCFKNYFGITRLHSALQEGRVGHFWNLFGPITRTLLGYWVAWHWQPMPLWLSIYIFLQAWLGQMLVVKWDNKIQETHQEIR